MTGYSVDVDALAELRGQMQRFLDTATDHLQRVEGLIGHVSASWDGTAAEAYQRRHREWVQALGELAEVLDEFKAWSTAAEDAYRTAMATNLRMAQG